MSEDRRWHFWMDTGGTFTDCLACDPEGEWRRCKVLSSGAVRARIAARVDLRTFVLGGVPPTADGLFVGFGIGRPACGPEALVDTWSGSDRRITLDRAPEWSVGEVVDLTTGEEAPVIAMRLVMGVPRRDPFPAATLRLATTRGTNTLLEGRGAPVAFFVTEGFADLLRIGDQRRPDLFAIRVQKPPPLHGPVVEVRGRIGADGSELAALDLMALRTAARQLHASGIDVAAVALMHSYRNPAHERAVAALLREIGFRHVSVSSELAPMIKIVPRAETAVVDATLGPVMEQYLDGVAAAVDAGDLHVMTSAGGLIPRARYRPKDSLLSGPAGGVAGAAAVARRAGLTRIITFDMGGTSTDVARFDGDFDYQFEHAVGPARVMAPALRVESVAAGGGSICRFDGAALTVGPESAGARPGPACYGSGGPLTLTDVNLLLGRLDPAHFGLPVFPHAAEAALATVLDEIARARGGAPDRGDVLRGFVEIADERMAEAIRRISLREGYDPAEYALVAFGGAGGLHACAVAARLGMRAVLHPADAGVLSAFGLHCAVEERILERQALEPLDRAMATLPALIEELAARGRAELSARGLPDHRIMLRRAEVELRYAGQDAGLAVACQPLETLADRHADAYRSRFGYAPSGRTVEVVAVRVIISTTDAPRGREFFADRAALGGPIATDPVQVFARSSLFSGQCLAGPSLVQDAFSTLFVAEGWEGRVGSADSLLLERAAVGERRASGTDEVVELELFTNRFRAVVSDMGLLLQRCAVSVNVKERLDFSCALLDATGELVTNAPHVPVHLGALGLCVRRVANSIALGPGDVVVTNHPAFGGAHLPDVTLIAPVFASDGALLAYVANRAHHAEIGGVRPGSMPPSASCLAEEGVVIPPMHLVRGGVAAWDSVAARLRGGPYPSRRVDENIADLHAQLAAIRLGARMVEELAARHTASCVQHYMQRLKDRAAFAIRDALERLDLGSASASDVLDDGTPIVVCISRVGSGWCVDFTGSGAVHPGNLNATPAIVRSAVMYVLRLLAGRDLPLNEGLMRDVEIVLPDGLLAPRFEDDPRRCPAVVGGNTETSQRVVDVLVRALGLAASSQGTMNNLIFGNARFSYYETIGGGTGAGDGFHGCSGVHSHMTNTAITDPEILEQRLPVRVERFALRRGTGGTGRFSGGDGLERVIRFLEPVDASVLTQRRRRGPPGLAGGGSGAPGEQWIEHGDDTRRALQAVDGTSIGAGDRLIIRTPGGGGWGA